MGDSSCQLIEFWISPISSMNSCDSVSLLSFSDQLQSPSDGQVNCDSNSTGLCSTAGQEELVTWRRLTVGRGPDDPLGLQEINQYKSYTAL